MPDIASITLPSGSTYSFKDTVARGFIQNLTGSITYVLCTEDVDTPVGIDCDYYIGSTHISYTGELMPELFTLNKIYLVRHADEGGLNNICDEYMTIETETSTYAWEKLGSISADNIIPQVSLVQQCLFFTTPTQTNINTVNEYFNSQTSSEDSIETESGDILETESGEPLEVDLPSNNQSSSNQESSSTNGITTESDNTLEIESGEPLEFD